jgi:hypothetical protein
LLRLSAEPARGGELASVGGGSRQHRRAERGRVRLVKQME